MNNCRSGIVEACYKHTHHVVLHHMVFRHVVLHVCIAIHWNSFIGCRTCVVYYVIELELADIHSETVASEWIEHILVNNEILSSITLYYGLTSKRDSLSSNEELYTPKSYVSTFSNVYKNNKLYIWFITHCNVGTLLYQTDIYVIYGYIILSISS